MIDIKKIDPKLHNKYSPNLFKYLNHRNHKKFRENSRVFKDTTGYLYIGIIQDGDFIGSTMMRVLCNGSKAEDACYCGANKIKLKEIKNFWEQYILIGRCVCDPEHIWFGEEKNNRFTINGKTRTCNWCGEVHRRIEKKRTVVDVSWSK